MIPMGFRDRIKSVFLGDSESPKPVAPKSQKAEKVKSERIDRDNLEDIYMNDGIAFSAVNTIVQTFMSADFSIKTAEKDEGELHGILDKSDFNHLVLKMVQDLCIYGNAYIEIVRDNDENITSLDWVDAKSMDFIRNGEGNVLYDNNQKPKGFVQKLPFNYDTSDIPESDLTSTKTGKKAIKFDNNEILHLVLYNVGDSPLGVGILEPLYKEFMIKMNIEEALGESIYRKGYPVVVAKAGNEEHPPSPNDIDHLKNIMKDFQSNDEIVMPYYMDIEYLEASHPEKMHSTLEYYVDLIISGLGIPKSFLTGIGGDANRSVLDKQSIMFERYVQLLQNLIGKQLKEKVFKPIAKQNDFRKMPDIRFEQVSTEDLNSKAERLKKYADAGLIEPNEDIRDEILKKENLD